MHPPLSLVLLLTLLSFGVTQDATDNCNQLLSRQPASSDFCVTSGVRAHSAGRRYALKTDDRCVYGKNIDFMPAEGAPPSRNMATGGPDECCAACASDPDCVVANYDIADSKCWLKTKGFHPQPNPMDKGGVDSLYLCRRTSADDPSLLAINKAAGCLPQAHGWAVVFGILGSAFAYVVGGLIYSVKVRQLPLGAEAMPHVDFWRELSRLVQDGVVWSRAQLGGKGGSLHQEKLVENSDDSEPVNE